MAARVLYGMPSGGHPHPEFITSMSAIRMSTQSDHKVADCLLVRAPVQMARNAIVLEAIKGDYDYLVMHDDDLEVAYGHPGNPIDVCIETMEKHPDCGLVGMMYLREEPRLPTTTMYHPEYGYREHCAVIAGFPNEPFKCGGIGFGFVVIRRQAMLDLQRLTEGPLVRFDHRKDVAGIMREIGEDYDFCDRLAMAGWKVYADPRFATRHHKSIGTLEYDWDSWHRKTHSDEFPSAFKLAHEAHVSTSTGQVSSMPAGSTITFREDMEVHALNGSQFVTVDGVMCLDISGIRFAEAKKLEEAAIERREVA